MKLPCIECVDSEENAHTESALKSRSRSCCGPRAEPDGHDEGNKLSE